MTLVAETSQNTFDARSPSCSDRNVRYASSVVCFNHEILSVSWNKGFAKRYTNSLHEIGDFWCFDDSSVAFSFRGDTEDSLTSTVAQDYIARIKELCADAAQDGYFLRSGSALDFWRFVASIPHIRRGNVVLMDNGNLRAVWKDGQGTHLGLQFLGGGMVQYVIFRRRGMTQPVSRVTGRDTFEGLKRQMNTFELHPLLCK